MVVNLIGIGDFTVNQFTRNIAGYMVNESFTFSGLIGDMLFQGDGVKCIVASFDGFLISEQVHVEIFSYN